MQWNKTRTGFKPRSQRWLPYGTQESHGHITRPGSLIGKGTVAEQQRPSNNELALRRSARRCAKPRAVRYNILCITTQTTFNRLGFKVMLIMVLKVLENTIDRYTVIIACNSHLRLAFCNKFHIVPRQRYTRIIDGLFLDTNRSETIAYRKIVP